MAKKVVETPLMKQYNEIKGKHPDAILLFRVGDFYETFSDDAIAAAEILGITLTRRANGAAQHVELAGFPHHALDTYLPKLVRAGRRVAICDQLEDPKKTKTLVKRGITEIVTPGVVLDDNVLSHKENNYLAALVALAPHGYGIAFLDISTGEFLSGRGDAAYIDKLLTDYRPKELLVERSQSREITQLFHPHASVFEMDDWLFGPENNRERLLRHFGVKTLKGFGLDGGENVPAVIAAGAILNYLDLTNHQEIAHVLGLRRIDDAEFVRLNRTTVRSLELLHPLSEEGTPLYDIIDETNSPMGARLLRKWIVFPLKDVSMIEARQLVVEDFVRDAARRDKCSEIFASVGDIERMAAKLAMGRIQPREFAQLGVSLGLLSPLKELLQASETPQITLLGERLDALADVCETITKTLRPDAPAAIGKGAIIQKGVSDELDSVRELKAHVRERLDDICHRAQEETGITSLKIASNNVFGYYLEVRNAHKDKVPENWIRKQTLVGAERYITEDLKLLEEQINGAEDRISELEADLYRQLVERAQTSVAAIQTNAQIIARLDVLLSFAVTALKYNYIRPVVNDSFVLDIKAGRHPVIERRLPPEDPYVPNDVHLDVDREQIAIITGPNMSGKSAFLRQTALITLLAQMGSYVPASEATIGLVDSIFTRVGASDNISLGESTFMVEMQEAADILNNITERSLVLFDELGRGTSTYDGISIAWAILEYLHNQAPGRAKTLFATHYHELAEISDSLARVHNYNVSAREINGKMLFLRTLVPGASEHSYGIQVARLAGMPQIILRRADELLKALEGSGGERTELPQGITASKKSESCDEAGMQMSFFQLDDPLLSDIRDRLLDVDINRLTPLEALQKLDEVQRLLRGH